jgi:hypothetical protein
MLVALAKKLHPNATIAESSDVTTKDIERWVADGAALASIKKLASDRVAFLIPDLSAKSKKFKAAVDALVDRCLHHLAQLAIKHGEKAVDRLRGTDAKGKRLPTQAAAVRTQMKSVGKVKEDPDRAGNTKAVTRMLKKARKTGEDAALAGVRFQREVGIRFGVSCLNSGGLVVVTKEVLIILDAKATHNRLDDEVSILFRSMYRQARHRLSYFGATYIYLPLREVLKSNLISATFKCVLLLASCSRPALPAVNSLPPAARHARPTSCAALP